MPCLSTVPFSPTTLGHDDYNGYRKQRYFLRWIRIIYPFSSQSPMKVTMIRHLGVEHENAHCLFSSPIEISAWLRKPFSSKLAEIDLVKTIMFTPTSAECLCTNEQGQRTVWYVCWPCCVTPQYLRAAFKKLVSKSPLCVKFNKANYFVVILNVCIHS